MASITVPKKVSETLQAKIESMEAGVTQNIPATSSLTVAGTAMAQPQILTQLQSLDALFTDVTAATTVRAAKVAARKAGLPAAKVFMAALTEAVKSQFAAGSPLLPSFGILPPKPRTPRTAAQKAIAAAKNAQTRALHGIKGSKQRAAISAAGTPGLVVVDATGQAIQTQGPVPPGGSAPVGVSVGPAVSGSAVAAAAGAAGSAAPAGK